MSNTMIICRFTALDTLFFRESRPFESIGGSELVSIFPPPPRTVLGAIRTAIGDAMQIDWRQFTEKTKDPKMQRLKDIIGYGDDYAALKLNGLWLYYQGKRPKKQGKTESEANALDIQERLYPIPALLLHKKEGEETSFARLVIGEPTKTYLGCVRLPKLPDGEQGYKPLDQHWVTQKGLESILQGGLPTADQLFEKNELFSRESRLGIVIDQPKRSVKKGGLFQAEHVRPTPQLAIDVELGGLQTTNLSDRGTMLRLGAEGRLSGLEILSKAKTPRSLDDLKKNFSKDHLSKAKGLIIVLLTPAKFSNTQYPWLPDGFTLPDKFDKESDIATWHGSIDGIQLAIQAAIVGKAQREGGWDTANRRPRPVQSLIPAGSCYYCELTNKSVDIQIAIHQLHGKAIGNDQHLGRGRIVCALWQASEF